MVPPHDACAGDDTSRRAADGRLPREHRRGVRGGEGHSPTGLDPGTERERRIRISGGCPIDVARGPGPDGALRCEGRIHYRDGRTAPFRARWQAQEGGVVVQAFQERCADGTSRDPCRGPYVPAPDEACAGRGSRASCRD